MCCITATVGHFTFWISLSLSVSLSPKFGLRPKISQKNDIIGSESRFLPTPPTFYVPVRGKRVSRRNIAIPFGEEKLKTRTVVATQW